MRNYDGKFGDLNRLSFSNHRTLYTTLESCGSFHTRTRSEPNLDPDPIRAELGPGPEPSRTWTRTRAEPNLDPDPSRAELGPGPDSDPGGSSSLTFLGYGFKKTWTRRSLISVSFILFIELPIRSFNMLKNILLKSPQ